MYEKLDIFFRTGKSYGIREYARAMKISPSTSKSYLEQLEKQSLLKSRREHNLLLFQANDNEDYRKIKIEYSIKKMSPIVEYLQRFNPTAIVLFGSVAKGTDNKDSDIDIAVVIPKTSKRLNLSYTLENREVQFFVFTKESFKKNKELANNIINGRILYGFLEVY